MKKAYKLILALVICLSLSGCCGSTGFIAGTAYRYGIEFKNYVNELAEMDLYLTDDGVLTEESKIRIVNLMYRAINDFSLMNPSLHSLDGCVLLDKEITFRGISDMNMKVYMYTYKLGEDTFQMYGYEPLEVGGIYNIKYINGPDYDVLLRADKSGEDDHVEAMQIAKINFGDTDTLETQCKINNLLAKNIDDWSLIYISDKSDTAKNDKLYDDETYTYTLQVGSLSGKHGEETLELGDKLDAFGPDGLEAGKYYIALGEQDIDDKTGETRTYIVGYTDVDEKVKEFLK